MGYKSNYNLRGLGEMYSGLKRLTIQEYETLLRLYRESTPTAPPIPITNGTHPPIGAGGEGPQHLALKEYVAANPSLVLGEPDVTTFAVERGFPTGDRADIVLRDRFGSFVGLEVEDGTSANKFVICHQGGHRKPDDTNRYLFNGKKTVS